MAYIVHSSISENGTNGWDGKAKAGDQTGKEVCTRTWYNKPWDMVLRYPDITISAQARDIAIKLANSNLVGYDQSQRNTLYKELEKNKWDVDKYIKSGIKTESDCSSFVYTVYCCVLPKLRGESNAPRTATMKSFMISKGFKCYTASDYTSSTNKLVKGDLLNKAGSHVVMFAGNDVDVDTIQVSKTVTEVSKDVINGLWGNGDERKQRLTDAGYNYEEVRAEVNRLLSNNSQPTVPKIEYYTKYSGNTVSIVVALKSIGVDSSYSNRKSIAIKNGITNYSGTNTQNIKLLNLLKQGKLIK